MLQDVYAEKKSEKFTHYCFTFLHYCIVYNFSFNIHLLPLIFKNFLTMDAKNSG